jgi:hypothetical protein
MPTPPFPYGSPLAPSSPYGNPNMPSYANTVPPPAYGTSYGPLTSSLGAPPARPIGPDPTPTLPIRTSFTSLPPSTYQQAPNPFTSGYGAAQNPPAYQISRPNYGTPMPPNYNQPINPFANDMDPNYIASQFNMR